jgi:hypothetical protein
MQEDQPLDSNLSTNPNNNTSLGNNLSNNNAYPPDLSNPNTPTNSWDFAVPGKTAPTSITSTSATSLTNISTNSNNSNAGNAPAAGNSGSSSTDSYSANWPPQMQTAWQNYLKQNNLSAPSSQDQIRFIQLFKQKQQQKAENAKNIGNMLAHSYDVLERQIVKEQPQQFLRYIANLITPHTTQSTMQRGLMLGIKSNSAHPSTVYQYVQQFHLNAGLKEQQEKRKLYKQEQLKVLPPGQTDPSLHYITAFQSKNYTAHNAIEQRFMQEAELERKELTNFTYHAQAAKLKAEAEQQRMDFERKKAEEIQNFERMKAKYKEIDWFVDLPLLAKKILSIAKNNQLTLPQNSTDVTTELIATATTNYMRGIIAELIAIKRKRVDTDRSQHNIVIVSDAKQAIDSYQAKKKQKIKQFVENYNNNGSDSTSNGANSSSHANSNGLAPVTTPTMPQLSSGADEMDLNDFTINSQDELNDLTGSNTNINERIMRYNRPDSNLSLMDVIFYLEQALQHRRSPRLYRLYLLLAQKISNWPPNEQQSTLTSYPLNNLSAPH